ncbi:hypothetical protein ES708_15978 [subsurface metagenome]
MDSKRERRIEQRLRYHWPIWFVEDFDETLSQGQMVDISSVSASFTCCADVNCPYPGQRVTSRFSVPRFGSNESFELASFTRTGSVCRVDEVSAFLRRITVQFVEPLPFRPGEQAVSESDAQQKLKAVTI